MLAPSLPRLKDAHVDYGSGERAPHVARGKGLHEATTGVTTSFSIQLVGEEGRNNRKKSGRVRGGASSPADWKPVDSSRFIYVWIASKDQVGKREAQLFVTVSVFCLHRLIATSRFVLASRRCSS